MLVARVGSFGAALWCYPTRSSVPTSARAIHREPERAKRAFAHLDGGSRRNLFAGLAIGTRGTRRALIGVRVVVYQTGVGTMLALSDALTTLTGAQRQRAQAEYNLAIARAQLRRALGLADDGG